MISCDKMKRTVFLLITLAYVCIALCGCNNLKAEDTRNINRSEERLEISFRFHRRGIASGQYAIWIEDSTGRLVRTIYATLFTVKGGYQYRKDAIPLWVSKSKLQTMSSAQVDAITGATPQNGVLTYQWNGTDDKGKRVPSGNYKFFVEGSMYWESRVVYSGDLIWGYKEHDSISIEKHFFNSSRINKNMITELKAYHIK